MYVHIHVLLFPLSFPLLFWQFDRTNNELFAQKRVLIQQEIMNGRSTVFMFLEQLLSNRQQLGSHSIAHSVRYCTHLLIPSWLISYFILSTHAGFITPGM